MFGKNKKQNSAYGIIGLGRFGYALAKELADSGAEIIVLDKDAEKIREICEYTENAYIVKNLDKKTLLETGIQNCDVAVICIGEQIDTSILTTLTLVNMGIKCIIAKATSAEHGQILEKLGAEVVYPEKDIAVRLAHRLEVSQVLDYIQLSEKLNISKLMVPNKLINKTVISANLRERFGANIIAIENKSELNDTVRPDYVFKKGDILFLSGSRENLNKLSEWAK